MNSRYDRQVKLQEIGEEGQKRLYRSSVVVVGAGGLGCPVLSYLTAAGVGRITIVDHDVVELSNLHRQPLYREEDIGLPKAGQAWLSLKDLNSNVVITPVGEQLRFENARELVSGHDLIIDCTDNLPTRYLLNDVAQIESIPMLMAGVHKFQAQLTLFGGKANTSFRGLYPSDSEKQTPPSCDQNGVLGSVVGVIGSLQANEALKFLAGQKISSDGKLLVLDLNDLSSRLIELTPAPERNEVELTPKTEYEHLCSQYKEVLVTELLEMSAEDYQLIDIREESKEPLHPLASRQIDPDGPVHVVLMCQKGIRSLRSLERFGKEHPRHSFSSLKGGVEALVNEES